MSVGAGSIKRAAKAAEGSVDTKKVAGGAEVKAAQSAESGTGAKAAKTTKSNAKTRAEKAAPAKSVAPKSSEKGSADSKASIAGKSAGAQAESKKSTTTYAAYGVGQELPIYLM